MNRFFIQLNSHLRCETDGFDHAFFPVEDFSSPNSHLDEFDFERITWAFGRSRFGKKTCIATIPCRLFTLMHVETQIGFYKLENFSFATATEHSD